MEVGLPQKSKFLLCGVYREWANLKLSGEHGEEQSSKKEQETRWDGFLDGWEDALDEQDDVTVIGDVNIDLNYLITQDISVETWLKT